MDSKKTEQDNLRERPVSPEGEKEGILQRIRSILKEIAKQSTQAGYAMRERIERLSSLSYKDTARIAQGLDVEKKLEDNELRRARLKEQAQKKIHDAFATLGYEVTADANAEAAPFGGGNLTMYDLPGQSPLTKHDVARYVSSKETTLNALAIRIERGLQDTSEYNRKIAAEMIEYAPVEDQAYLRDMLVTVILDGLRDKNPTASKTSAEMIVHAPEPRRQSLLKECLAHGSISVQEVAVSLIDQAPKKAQEGLRAQLDKIINNGLRGGYAQMPDIAKMIEHASKKMQPDFRARLTPIIKQGLQNKDDLYTRRNAVRMIPHALEQERTDMIKEGMADERFLVHTLAAEMIEYAPENERLGLIREGLISKDELIRSHTANMIRHAPMAERANLVIQVFERDNSTVCWRAIRILSEIPPQDLAKIKPLLPSIIKEGLRTDDREKRMDFVREIQFAPESERAQLIAFALSINVMDERRLAQDMIIYAPQEARAALWAKDRVVDTVETKELENLAEKTPLYRNVKSDFFRSKFNKTGSQTTLLGAVPGKTERTLKGKVIIRHIEFPAYAVWSRAFEAADFWKEKGFSYVPIEPIVDVVPDPKKSIDVAVFTRVLGPSVRTWEDTTTLFREHIDSYVERIRKTLKELGVEHGHIHKENFCLVFEKTSDGRADLTKPPRVYLIDFDQVKSLENRDHLV